MAIIALVYICIWAVGTVVIDIASAYKRKYIVPPIYACLVVVMIALEITASVLLWEQSENEAATALLVIMLILSLLPLLETFRIADGSLAIYSKRQAGETAGIAIAMIILSGFLYSG